MPLLDVFDPVWAREQVLDRGWSSRNAQLFEHYYRLVIEQIAAVVPISVLLLAVMGIFFGKSVDAPGEMVFGLCCAIIGLAAFVDSLRVVVMPLSEQLGTELPRTLSLPWVLCVTCFLGILVTYAEPAITSLRPLARLVDPEVAPYLYCALMEKQEVLVFCIGAGVGLAAMLGTLRFVKGWSLQPLIVIVLCPTLMCASYMWWGDRELRPLLGLAWDCGAVTTGPVTVPVLLALGIGVMKTQREKKEEEKRRKYREKHGGKEFGRTKSGKEQVAEAAADALEGFGIVTLASLFPVLAVSLLAITLKIEYTHEDILAMRPDPPDENALLEKTPYREIYFATRAIVPLIVALVGLVVVVLRKPLPEFTYYLPPDSFVPGAQRDFSNHDRSQGARRSKETGLRASLEGVRRSFEYVKSLFVRTNQPAKGGLSVWDKTLQGINAIAVARSEGISGSFRHAAHAPVREESSFMDRSSRSLEMEERPDDSFGGSSRRFNQRGSQQSFKGQVNPPKGEHVNWDDIDRAFSGEQLHEKTGRGETEMKPIKRQLTPAALEPQTSLSRSLTPGSGTMEQATNGANGHSEIEEEDVSKSVGFNEASKMDEMRQRESIDKLIVNRTASEGTDQGIDMQEKVESTPAANPNEAPPSGNKYLVLVAGASQALAAMVMFNLGLHFGFTSIGDQVGTLLPSAFLDTRPITNTTLLNTSAPLSNNTDTGPPPYYSYNVGVTIALGTMFVLGLLATRAEPALNVVGATVEKLTKGAFSKSMLIYSVCFGVGMGMVVGATKILFGVPLIWFILMKYAVALSLTAFSHEDFINIAWDSAGVTTGPVTVPFVLSTGVGCSKAVRTGPAPSGKVLAVTFHIGPTNPRETGPKIINFVRETHESQNVDARCKRLKGSVFWRVLQCGLSSRSCSSMEPVGLSKA